VRDAPSFRSPRLRPRTPRHRPDVKVELHPVTQEGGQGYDIVLHSAAKNDLAYRILFVRDHVVVLGAVAPSHAEGALGKIVESFHLV